VDLDVLRRSYDRFAPRYDEIFEAQQRPKIEALLAALPRPLPVPALDLGCGTGLVARISGLDAVCVDASHAMLARCPGLRRLQADMARLPLADAVFGLAFAVTSLIDFEPDLPAIAELARVLRPEGFAALSVLKIENVPALEAAFAREGLAVVARLDLGQDVGFVCRRGSAATLP
jgi:SAM-dependent methyltransferase